MSVDVVSHDGRQVIGNSWDNIQMDNHRVVMDLVTGQTEYLPGDFDFSRSTFGENGQLLARSYRGHIDGYDSYQGTVIQINPPPTGVVFSLTDDAGGRFQIDPVSGKVTVADADLLLYEGGTAHQVTVLATGEDGSTEASSFMVTVTDAPSDPTDADPAANQTPEIPEVGTEVGLVVFSEDPDPEDMPVVYSLDDDAGGRFSIDPASGVVTVARPELIYYQGGSQFEVEARATSGSGEYNTGRFSIDVVEATVTPVIDEDDDPNEVPELTSDRAGVGLDAYASDPDAEMAGGDSYQMYDPGTGPGYIDADRGAVVMSRDGSVLLSAEQSATGAWELVTRTDGEVTARVGLPTGVRPAEYESAGMVINPGSFSLLGVTDDGGSAFLGVRQGGDWYIEHEHYGVDHLPGMSDGGVYRVDLSDLSATRVDLDASGEPLFSYDPADATYWDPSNNSTTDFAMSGDGTVLAFMVPVSDLRPGQGARTALPTT